jgi:type IV secretion system protein VirB10
VLQGSVVPAVIITEINSDLPGQITAQVTMDVYDSHSKYLLIPKGSRLVGNYNNDVTPGQERVMAAFRRLIRPDGTSIDLGGMTSADMAGQSGMQDQVNNHFWKMFGSSLMIAGVAWLTERDQPGTVMVGGGGATSPEKASGQILKDMSDHMLKRNTRIPPTLTIRRGHKFVVTVTRDIALPPIAVALR